VTDKVEDTSQMRKLRRDVARLLTERGARRVAQA
jgi:ribosomal protein L29